MTAILRMEMAVMPTVLREITTTVLRYRLTEILSQMSAQVPAQVVTSLTQLLSPVLLASTHVVLAIMLLTA